MTPALIFIQARLTGGSGEQAMGGSKTELMTLVAPKAPSGSQSDRANENSGDPFNAERAAVYAAILCAGRDRVRDEADVANPAGVLWVWTHRVRDAKEQPVPMAVIGARRHSAAIHGQLGSQSAFTESKSFARAVGIIQSVISKYIQEDIDDRHIAKLGKVAIGNVHERGSGLITDHAQACGRGVILIASRSKRDARLPTGGSVERGARINDQIIDSCSRVDSARPVRGTKRSCLGLRMEMRSEGNHDESFDEGSNHIFLV